MGKKATGLRRGGRGAGGLPRPGVLLFVYAPGSREDAAEGVLPGLRQGPCADSGHRAVPAVFPALHAAAWKEKSAGSGPAQAPPVPRAASLAELNQMLADADEVDEHRRIAARIETVGQAAAREVPLLNPVTGQRVPGSSGVVVPGRRERR